MESSGRPSTRGGRRCCRTRQETGGVARHVGPVLVDDADHAEGDPDLGDLQSVGPHPTFGHFAYWVGEGRDLPHPAAMPRTRPSVRRSRSRAASTMPAASARSRSAPLASTREADSSSSRSAANRSASWYRARGPCHDPSGRPDAARELLQCGRGHPFRLQGRGRRDGRRPGCAVPSTRWRAPHALGPGPWRRPRHQGRRSRRRRPAGRRRSPP